MVVDGALQAVHRLALVEEIEDSEAKHGVGEIVAEIQGPQQPAQPVAGIVDGIAGGGRPEAVERRSRRLPTVFDRGAEPQESLPPRAMARRETVSATIGRKTCGISHPSRQVEFSLLEPRQETRPLVALAQRSPSHPGEDRRRSLTEAIDTSGPAGRMMMQMLGSFAEFERAMVRERTRAGLKAAREQGRKGGRRSKLVPRQRAEILAMLADGRAGAEIARIFRVHRATISRIAAEARTVSPKTRAAPEAVAMEAAAEPLLSES